MSTPQSTVGQPVLFAQGVHLTHHDPRNIFVRRSVFWDSAFGECTAMDLTSECGLLSPFTIFNNLDHGIMESR
jgi:hypothetical protein